VLRTLARDAPQQGDEMTFQPDPTATDRAEPDAAMDQTGANGAQHSGDLHADMGRSALHIQSHMKRSWPFYWISRVNARYVQVLERKLKPIGLDVARWRVLISLYEEEYLSVSEISDFSTMRLNTTTKVVQRMIADDLVRTRVRATDGRVTEVCLTAKGDALRARALDEATKILAASFVNVSAEELSALNATMEKVFAEISRI
jgi:MarR family transcriptional regulator, organic hydroperoxide resistance regulator